MNNTEPTTEQKIEKIAMRVMGWKKKDITTEFAGKKYIDERWYKKGMPCPTRGDWNPYTDWNHTHMVLDKVMEDMALWSRFCRHWHRKDADNRLGEYMKASKEELMTTLYLLLTEE